MKLKIVGIMVLAIGVLVGLALQVRSGQGWEPPLPPDVLETQVSGGQFFRSFIKRTITGCCFGFGEFVRADLGTTPTAVVIIFNTHLSGDNLGVGLKVNGGGCFAWGVNGLLQNFPRGVFADRTTQLIVPASFLRPGVNTFELCGGSAGSTQLAYRTMALRKGN